MDIAQLLTDLIEKAGMKQEALAQLLNVSQSSISRAKNDIQELGYSKALRIIELAHEKGLLTNKMGTSYVMSRVRVQGRMRTTDEVSTDGAVVAVEQADLPFAVPNGCFAIIIDDDGLIERANRGDLVIVGPLTNNLENMVEAEGAIILSDGRMMFGRLEEGRSRGTYSIIGRRGRRSADMHVIEMAPFFSTIAAGRWQPGT